MQNLHVPRKLQVNTSIANLDLDIADRKVFYFHQAERDGLMEEKESLDTQVAQLEKGKEELLRDNRRMAEMLATSEGDSQEVADMLERLSQERRQLRRQCQQLRENGRWGLGTSLT